jgi:hypothetical protein
MCFTGITLTERELLVTTYANLPTQEEQVFWGIIQPIYPDLYSYINWDYITQEKDWIVRYFKAYVQSKVRNSKSDVQSDILNTVSKDHEAFWTWYHDFTQEGLIILVIRLFGLMVLGIEWLPPFSKITPNYWESSGYIVDEIHVASC